MTRAVLLRAAAALFFILAPIGAGLLASAPRPDAGRPAPEVRPSAVKGKVQRLPDAPPEIVAALRAPTACTEEAPREVRRFAAPLGRSAAAGSQPAGSGL